jgi:hypothetical protein
MIDAVRSKFSRIVTSINDSQFLIEGSADFIKLSCELDETSLNFADIQGGPFLHIGYDFFGKGKIKSIEKVSIGEDGSFIFKLTINKYDH